MPLRAIQRIEWYAQLLENGIVYGNTKYAHESFLQPHHWLMEKMDERIGT